MIKLLLFDQNLSPRLINLLADIYPASAHVDGIGLPSAPDREVWDYARQHDYIVVTKDADFSELSLLLGVSSQGNLDTARKLLDAGYRAATKR